MDLQVARLLRYQREQQLRDCDCTAYRVLEGAADAARAAEVAALDLVDFAADPLAHPAAGGPATSSATR